MNSGANAAFWVTATGAPPLSYQWYFNGAPITGATGPLLFETGAQPSNAGSYNVTIGNALGTAISNPAVLSVSTINTGNALGFILEPVSQTIASGSTVVFTAQAGSTGATVAVRNAALGRTGGSPAANASATTTYQWFYNGITVPGATDSTYVLTGATAANNGTYACVAVDSSGAVESSPASLTAIASADPGRLTNLSCRAQVGTGADIMTAGFVVGGAGTSGVQSVLVRGSGPALGVFGLTGLLPDPKLTLNNTSDSPSMVVATDTGWGGNAAIAAEAATLGAFSWGSTATPDSALLQALSPDNYTAQIAGASGDKGLALVEVYDATPAGTYTPATPRLVNLSALIQVGSGANVVFAGFVIGGSTAKTVLIRASGPALAAAPFGFSGALTDPQLTLTNTSANPSQVITVNTGWGGDPEINSVAGSVGAFQWSLSGNDSAILVTLPPGDYTAGVQGASGDTGLSLIELYEVP